MAQLMLINWIQVSTDFLQICPEPIIINLVPLTVVTFRYTNGRTLMHVWISNLACNLNFSIVSKESRRAKFWNGNMASWLFNYHVLLLLYLFYRPSGKNINIYLFYFIFLKKSTACMWLLGKFYIMFPQ